MSHCEGFLSAKKIGKLKKITWAAMAALLCLFVVLVPSSGASSKEPVVSVQDVSDSIFRIATIDENGTVITLGTGFALGDSAPVSYVATSNHVIENYKDNIMVWMNRDHFVNCTVAISLAQMDLAVLKLEKPINKPPLPLGSAAYVQQGDQIYTFGFPDYDITDRLTAYPGDVTATTGAISKKTKLNDIEYYQVDATVNSGNSGGPLFHKETGSVIGIITIKSTVSDDINGAVYIERLMEALDLESVPYTTIDDFIQSGLNAQPQETPDANPQGASENSDNIQQQRGVTSQMLLKVGIGLAVVAIVLLIVALFLRMRDKKTSDDYQIEMDDRDEIRGEKLQNNAPQPLPRSPANAAPKRDEPVFPKGKDSPTMAPIDGKAPALQNDSGKRPVVKAVSGFFTGGIVPVGSQVMIGRDAAICQLVYPMDMTSVSRQHVKISYDRSSGSFLVTDMSTNGTFSEGGKRLKKNQAERLAPGSQIYLSDKEELYRLELEEA